MALSIQYWCQYVEGFHKLTKKSEAAVESQRVLKFVYDTDYKTVLANVQASMRDRSYKVEIELEDGFGVKHTKCECPMQMYKCHHVAAVLLFGYKNVSKTDIRCSWLKHPKSAPPKITKNMSDLFPSRRPDYRALRNPFSQEDRKFLYDQLGLLGRFTALHWILSPEPKSPSSSVPMVEDLLLRAEYLESTNPISWLRKALIVSPEIIQKSERETVGQRENALWAAARKKRFTASNFGQILSGVKNNRITPSLKKRLCSAYNLDRNVAVQWGIIHEAEGIESYTKLGADTQPSGIWLHESGVLAASPDGLVTRGPVCVIHQQTATRCDPQLLEVKCPYSARNITVQDAAKTLKSFFLGITEDGSLFLKPNHDYYHQIQGQMYMSNTQCLDLVVWTTVDMQVIRISKDPSWASNISSMIDFYFNKFISSFD